MTIIPELLPIYGVKCFTLTFFLDAYIGNTEPKQGLTI